MHKEEMIEKLKNYLGEDFLKIIYVSSELNIFDNLEFIVELKNGDQVAIQVGENGIFDKRIHKLEE